MKLKCLKFCFLNSVAFCARTQIKQTQSWKGFLESHQEQLFLPHFGTVVCYLGSRFFWDAKSRFADFLQGPGSWFSGFFRVPGPGFAVFLGSCYGPTRVHGHDFSGFLGSWIPVFRYATPEICLKVCLNFQQMGFVTIQVFKYAHMVTSKSTQE